MPFVALLLVILVIAAMLALLFLAQRELLRIASALRHLQDSHAKLEARTAILEQRLVSGSLAPPAPPPIDPQHPGPGFVWQPRRGCGSGVPD